MITNIRIINTMDVSIKNEAYNINKTFLPTSLNVAATSWLLSSRDRIDARIFILREIFSLILERFPSFTLWCVVGDSAWQSDTKMIRYKKLFKRLKARGVEITHANNFAEAIVEGEGKLKFYGAAQLSELSIESVVKVMAKESCSYIVAVPNKYDIKTLISKGWEAHQVIDSSLLGSIVENNGLIFKELGGFDDQESGYVGLGLPRLVKKLTQ